MAEQQKLTAQQRAMLFGASTRQHYQTLGTQTVNGGAQTISFRVPKSRLLQSVKLHVAGTIHTGSGAGEFYHLKNKLGIYDMIRRVSIDFNNGFNPIVVSGGEMALINMLYPNPEMILPAEGTKKNTLCWGGTSVEMAIEEKDRNCEFEFFLDIPLTVNYRDPVGLVLAQNSETNIDIIIDFANLSNIYVADQEDYPVVSAEYKNVKVTPMITSFSIPSDSRAFPDMSVLKVCDSRNESVTAGQNYIKLPVGMIYRKLILKFEDENGLPMKDEDITSNIELVMNTADTPYSISPKMLRAVNKMQSGLEMPEGIYYWSFDYQGINGYGGSRDYIDTERVTEFAVRFTSGKVGKVHIISEKLSRLIAG